jgi:hypothetical protein
MADTRRTKAEILALFADNTSGNISPQDLRDFVVTVMGGYASLKTVDGVTAQTGITSTPVLLTTWDTNGDSNGLTADHTTDSITIDVDGVYDVDCDVSFSGSSNAIIQMHLRVNGVEEEEGMHRKLSAGGDVGSAGFNGGLTLSAGDVLTVYVESNITASITPVDAQFRVNQKA